MRKDVLRERIKKFVTDSHKDQKRFDKDLAERVQITVFYQKFSRERILSMTAEDIYDYLSPLWAMLIWGNKHYVVDKIVEDNGLELFRQCLAELVWGEDSMAIRWDSFRRQVKGMGPAMMSEILCKTHPNDFVLWNRRAYVALNYLKVEDLPRYDYQLTGSVYMKLCDVCKEIAAELRNAGFEDTTLLAVDYFIWEQLQVEDNLSKVYTKGTKKSTGEKDKDESNFIHNDIRDKLRDIGIWLGFTARTEQKISEGSRVDTVWEATIGNMGRIIYVFEVQTGGSIDSLIVNLLKSLNNQAVQGVVAVSDCDQIERIKSHAQDVKELRDKVKYWDYEEILQVHESLEFVYTSINKLQLVPQGF